jgi:hypothetical protein
MTSRPASGPGSAGIDAQPEGEDAEWVSSLLLTWPGKRYRVDADDDARDDAAHEALEAAARSLIDRVLTESPDAAKGDAPEPDPPS